MRLRRVLADANAPAIGVRSRVCFTAAPSVPDHPQRRCGTGRGAGTLRAPLVWQAAQRQAERLSGPRGRLGAHGAGRVRLGAATSNPESPPGNTGVGQERPGWEISRREVATRARNAEGPGWFDNRSATTTLNDRTVQALRVPRPGSGMHQTRARALVLRLAASPGRCRAFREIRPAAGAIPGLAVVASTTSPATAGRRLLLRCGQLGPARRAGGSGPRTL
jgi:hypothetical protein